MSNWMTKKFVQFMVRDEGQGTAEYAVILGIIVVAAVVALGLFKTQLQNIWTTIQTSLGTVK